MLCCCRCYYFLLAILYYAPYTTIVIFINVLYLERDANKTNFSAGRNVPLPNPLVCLPRCPVYLLESFANSAVEPQITFGDVARLTFLI
jgi:hypothetical protein